MMVDGFVSMNSSSSPLSVHDSELNPGGPDVWGSLYEYVRTVNYAGSKFVEVESSKVAAALVMPNIF